METTFRKGCSQGFAQVCKDLSSIQNRRLSTTIKLTLYKVMSRSFMTYTCPIWEYEADPNLLKLQHLQNRILRAIDKLNMRKLVRELHTVFNIPYVNYYINKL
jgi:hypothetical protein